MTSWIDWVGGPSMIGVFVFVVTLISVWWCSVRHFSTPDGARDIGAYILRLIAIVELSWLLIVAANLPFHGGKL
ncbi:MAG: hypothetical protein KGL39_13775 [Patescibacteria group bacterium]|nr:hypothetical protein [Patescibacteria group bacterium]